MAGGVAFISDIHGNAPALQAVLADIETAGCSQVFFLGDVINGVDPHGCVQMLHRWSAESGIALTCLKGNAESYLTTLDRASLPRQDEAWNREVMALVQWFEDHLTLEDLAWIETLPVTLLWQGNGHSACLVHDSPLDRLAVEHSADPQIRPEHREWFFHGNGIMPDLEGSALDNLLAYMQAENISSVFCGHTHQAFWQEFDGKLVCNVGSVGAPLDGDPRPAWVYLAEGSTEVSIRRVTYDLERQLAQIDQAVDYPGFSSPLARERYKLWIKTGRHWKEHQGT